VLAVLLKDMEGGHPAAGLTKINDGRAPYIFCLISLSATKIQVYD
jgi:hypothetical protein